MPELSINSAVILAAGRGTRMGKLTSEIPKPMLPVQGRPMLEHIVERLGAAGVRRFLLVVGFRGDLIRRQFGVSQDIEFITQEPVDGTGSAALLAREFAGEKPFFLTYGDILCAPGEYARAANVLASDECCAAAVAVKEVDDPWQGAAVYEQDGRITRIIEKPPKGSSTTRWNSAGFYALRPGIFEYLADLEPSPRGEYELTSALSTMVARGLDLRISPIEGAWRDVGRPEDLAAV